MESHRQMPNGDSPKEPEEASSDGLPDERSSPSGVAERHHRVKDADTASLPGQSCPQMPKSLLHNVRAKQSMKVYKRGKAKPRPERSKSKIARNATEARDTNHETHHMNGVAPAPMTTQFRGTHQHLRVTIHEARKLIAKDMNGYSDPFVQVELEGQRTRTRVVPSSLNPRWEQVVHLMLPQILDGHSDKLKLTVLDYDGPLLQPRFLGRVEVPVADVWHAWKQGNSFSHKWYKLLGNRRTKQSDRGDLCLSLSFVDSHELSESTNQFLGPADKSESLKDADLNEWKLRVRIHHARAFDASPQDIEEFETLREYCYSVTVRLGSLERKTSFSQGNLSVVQEGQERTGMFLHTSWDETFDIPLEEATKTLKLDARINNQIMQLGNLIGLDGKFYDARKAMTNTDDVRFLISRVSKQDLPPSNRPPDNIPINGVGQFPLSAVFAFSTDPDEDLCDLKEAEANNSGSPDKAKQQQQQQQRESGASRASPSTMPEDLRNGSPGDHSSKGRAFMPRWQSFVSKAGKALEERVGWAHHHHSPMRSTVSVDGSDSDCESSSSSNSDDDGVVTGPVAQQAWIPIGGRNGAIAAELLVSLMFVKGGPERKSSPGAVSQKGQQKEDFEQWLNDLVEPAGDDEKAEPMAAVPPPLKDATFVDEELDIPLHRLFYMQVNQGSKFNKLRRFEQEIRDLEVHDWQDPEGGVKAQNSSFIMKLPPNKIGPNEAYTEVEMVVETLSKRGYVLRQTIKNPQITFGDTFYTMVQTVAIPVSPTRTRLQVSFASEFVKSCIFKSTIQRASLAGAQKGCGKDLEIIKRLISGEDEPGPGCQSLESSSIDGMRARIGAHGADAGRLFGSGWVVSVLVALLAVTIGVLAMLVWNTQQVLALQVESQAAQGRLMERMLDVLDHLSESRSEYHQDMVRHCQYQ